jgi:hypothetical protein
MMMGAALNVVEHVRTCSAAIVSRSG